MRWSLVLISVLMAGCTTLGKALANRPVPGYGVDERAAALMNCDADSIKVQAQGYARRSYDAGGPGYIVPSVGDSGCDVLAKLGMPDNVGTIEWEGRGEVQFWYHTGSTQTYDRRTHLVTLRPGQERSWVVSSVVW